MIEEDLIDFGPLPDAINQLLQEGVVAYFEDRPAADALFRRALSLAPAQLPVYFCLYKIHTYQRHLDAALEAAHAGLAEAARQCGLPPDWRGWRRETHDWMGTPEARFALYTLKAMAFIHLRREENALADEVLAHLKRLDPEDCVGGAVVRDIAAGVAAQPQAHRPGGGSPGNAHEYV